MNNLIIALDVDTEQEALELVDRFLPYVGTFKVGKQLFTGAGPAIVERINARGGRVFLDLKFHDIPNTVRKAAAQATRLGVFMFNVHASGGVEMARQAKEAAIETAARTGAPVPLVLGVTVLTSMGQDDLSRTGVCCPLQEQVLRLCALAQEAGLDGVVCSAHEISAIRRQCGNDFVLVVPGIRFSEETKGDQKRIATPRQALELGATYLVIGRALTAAADPERAWRTIEKELT